VLFRLAFGIDIQSQGWIILFFDGLNLLRDNLANLIILRLLLGLNFFIRGTCAIGQERRLNVFRALATPSEPPEVLDEEMAVWLRHEVLGADGEELFICCQQRAPITVLGNLN